MAAVLLLSLLASLAPPGASLGLRGEQRGACNNSRRECAVLADSGRCALARGYMVESCEKSCSACPQAKAMPLLGFGTCCRSSAKGQAVIDSTKAYLAEGGRLIDTADAYNNHRDLAVAIRESGVPREELWVTSKVWQEQTPEQVVQRVDTALAELGLEYLDLMLNHGPVNQPGVNEARWRGLVAAKKAGKVRNIGVSNFDVGLLKALEAQGLGLPTVNQIKYHPWVDAQLKETVKYCKEKGILVTAYFSFGGSRHSRDAKKGGDSISVVAAKHGVSNPQVLLRWALDQGIAVIPGATSQEHIKENLHLPDFHLDDSDYKLIEENNAPVGWP